MADIEGTTRAQTKFLRACAKSPCGIPADQIPDAAALRRWMRRPGFRRALPRVRGSRLNIQSFTNSPPVRFSAVSVRHRARRAAVSNVARSHGPAPAGGVAPLYSKPKS